MTSPKLDRLLDYWPRLTPDQQAAIVALATHYVGQLPNAGLGVRPTVEVQLPRTTDSAEFAKPRHCPDCGRRILPPRAKSPPEGYCWSCGCPLPVWDWGTV